MKKNDSGKTGLGIVEVGQVVLVILKLTNLINWTWVQVMLPTIISWSIVLVLLIFIAVLDCISNKKPRRKFE